MKRFLAVVLAVVLVGTAAAVEHIRSDGHGGFWNSDGSHPESYILRTRQAFLKWSFQ